LNRVVPLIREPFVLFVNPDCRVEPKAVDALVATLRSHSRFAAVVPAMRYPDGTFGIAGGVEPTVFKEWLAYLQVDKLIPASLRRWLARRSRFPVIGGLLGYADATPTFGLVETEWISGWCMLVRVSAFVQVGGFDENFFMYFEDADLCRRLRAAGFQVGIVGYVSAEHEESTAANRVGKGRLYACGMRVYFEKHGSWGTRLFCRALAKRMGG
jgi:GT2 family glycosyltransferase